MKILAFSGSPRKVGNSSRLLEALFAGAHEGGAETEALVAGDLNLDACTGCLKCNLLKRCRIRGDCWGELSGRILDADALVFASPVYFHHLPAPLKAVVDRFRSFMHVAITETGLVHTPWHRWKKDFVLLLAMGSSSDADARPIRDLFEFITRMLGNENRLHVLMGTRLAVADQVTMDEEELRALYARMSIPDRLAAGDFRNNRALLDQCRKLGRHLASGSIP